MPKAEFKFSLSRLYPIVDAEVSESREYALAQAYLEGGATLLQVRAKRLADARFLDLLLRIAGLCREHEACLVVNDRVDLALAAGAQGVHLGQDDLPVEAARRLLGPQRVVGYSTHNPRQLDQAQALDVDYVAVGPIFDSPSKPGEGPSIGLPGFREMVGRSRRHPVVAIGGIDLERACQLWAAGADSVAVISDLSRHPRPVDRVREYLKSAEEIRS